MCLTVNSNDHRPSPLYSLFWTEPICFNNDGQVPVPPDLRPGNEPDPDFCWNALVVNPCDLYLSLYNVGPPRLFFLVNKNPMNTYEYYIGIINHSEIEVMWPPSLFPTW